MPGGKMVQHSNRKQLDCSGKVLPRMQDVEANILKVVKGQDEHVRTIVTAVYRSILLNIKSNVLVMGGSGTGKTEILKQLAHNLNKVYVIEDANEFVQEGFQGKYVSEIARDLFYEANYNIKEAEQGMVIIDEIDKKAARPTNERDVSGLGVLNSLLKVIEGKKIKFNVGNEIIVRSKEISTDNLIIFFAGAFSEMKEIKKLKHGTSIAGFAQSEGKVDSITETKQIKQDLVDYGFPEEFVGRIDTIVQLNELSEEVLIEILKNSQNSVFRKYQKQLKEYGIQLKFCKKLFVDIARKAKNAKTGARELANIVNYMFEKILHDVFCAEKGTYSKCILKKGIESDNTRYILK